MMEAALVGAWLVALVALFLVLALVRRVGILAEVVAHGTAGGELGLEEGSRLPDFEAVGVDGEPIRSEEVRAGRPALIGLLSATCATCREELPHFNKLSQMAVRKGWVSLVVMSDDTEAGRDLVTAFGSEVQVLLSEDKEAAALKALRVTYFPTFYAVDADARILSRAFSVKPLRAVIQSSA